MLSIEAESFGSRRNILNATSVLRIFQILARVNLLQVVSHHAFRVSTCLFECVNSILASSCRLHRTTEVVRCTRTSSMKHYLLSRSDFGHELAVLKTWDVVILLRLCAHGTNSKQHCRCQKSIDFSHKFVIKVRLDMNSK